MSKIFALFALVLIVSGVLVLAVPRDEPSGRSLGPGPAAAPTLLGQARNLAEQLNAPLSIAFGVVSLFYSRRSYQINQARAEADRAK